MQYDSHGDLVVQHLITGYLSNTPELLILVYFNLYL